MDLSKQLGRIHAGDCVTAMRALPDECVDLVFADPPFNIGYQYDVYEDSLESDQYIEWCEAWMLEVHRIGRADAAFWLAIGDEYAAELKVLASRIGFHCRSWVIWYYTFGVHCKNKFTRSHAHLFHFVKNAKHFKFNADDPSVRVPSARQLVYNDRRANPKGRMPDDTWILRPQDLPTGFTASEDVWYFPRVAGTFKEREGFHGCQMPEQLLGRIIRSCSHPGDIVLDPFSGSGTTVAVAKKLARQFISFDVSEEYVELGTSRLNRIDVGDPLDGSDDPLNSIKVTRAIDDMRRHDPVTARIADQRRRTRSRELQLTLALEDMDPQHDVAADDAAILQAWRESHDGFSLDRVLLDPVLKKRLRERCRRNDVTWPMSQIGKRLLQLRTLGELTTEDDCLTTPTVLDPALMRRFAFASEIAWRVVTDRVPGWTLEEIFLDDDLANSFDRTAALHASESADGFMLRWIAISMRDQTASARHQEQTVPLKETDWSPPAPIDDAVDEVALRRICDGWPRRGLLRLTADDGGRTLYVGGADDLGIRLRDHFDNRASIDHWRTLAEGDLRVDALSVPDEMALLTAQCVWLRQHPESACNQLDLFLPLITSTESR